MSATGSHAFGLHLTQARLSTGRQWEGEGGEGGEKKEGKKRDRDREMGRKCSSVQLPAM